MWVKAAGGQLNQCVFVGSKTAEEIRYAPAGIYAFNVESFECILQRIARQESPVAIRSIPTWMPRPTSKSPQALTKTNSGSLWRRSRHSMPKCPRCLTCICGAFKCISAQRTKVKPFVDAVKKMVPLVKPFRSAMTWSVSVSVAVLHRLRSCPGEWVASVVEEQAGQGAVDPEIYAQKLVPLLKPLDCASLSSPTLHRRECGYSGHPGRIHQNTGQKHFVIVDAAMNDLIRPSFYDAYHEIVPVRKSRARGSHRTWWGRFANQRYLLQKPTASSLQGGRFAGHAQCGRLCLYDGLQLQYSGHACRNPGGGQSTPRGSKAADPAISVATGVHT